MKKVVMSNDKKKGEEKRVLHLKKICETIMVEREEEEEEEERGDWFMSHNERVFVFLWLPFESGDSTI
jgi:hypothetical protein